MTVSAFARRDIDRITDAAWELDQGLPRLPAAPGWLVCDLDRAGEGGDHLLLIGTVTSADSRTAAPRVYGYRTFGTHSGYARDGLGTTALTSIEWETTMSGAADRAIGATGHGCCAAATEVR
ncbi:flavin reductase [Streptomyces sp. NBC_01014]|uniref:flavin reductase n=1 Tax=Streptomyces sp. NBC_01014 TaxID=2903719 RepID=UPI00387063C7|nr:flavin reductase [Streptomyces sp. NBC_01014]